MERFQLFVFETHEGNTVLLDLTLSYFEGCAFVVEIRLCLDSLYRLVKKLVTVISVKLGVLYILVGGRATHR